MKKGFRSLIVFLIFGSVFFVACRGEAAETLFAYCFNKFAREKVCPVDYCRLACVAAQGARKCEDVCLPQKCTEIPLENCPTDFCAVVKDCSGEEICHFRLLGETPVCGDTAYTGQDVACCEGLERRCGVQFFEGHCDMEGKNSAYNLPICIPCGNGVCEQFEDRCNCPEDCGTDEYKGKTFEDIIYPEIDQENKKIKFKESLKGKKKENAIIQAPPKKQLFDWKR